MIQGCASIRNNSESRPITINSNDGPILYNIKTKRGVTIATGITPSIVRVPTKQGYFKRPRYIIEYQPFRENCAVFIISDLLKRNPTLGNILLSELIPERAVKQPIPESPNCTWQSSIHDEISVSIDPFYYLNFLSVPTALFGGAIIDPLTGGMWKLPEEILISESDGAVPIAPNLAQSTCSNSKVTCASTLAAKNARKNVSRRERRQVYRDNASRIGVGVGVGASYGNGPGFNVFIPWKDFQFVIALGAANAKAAGIRYQLRTNNWIDTTRIGINYGKNGDLRPWIPEQDLDQYSTSDAGVYYGWSITFDRAIPIRWNSELDNIAFTWGIGYRLTDGGFKDDLARYESGGDGGSNHGRLGMMGEGLITTYFGGFDLQLSAGLEYKF